MTKLGPRACTVCGPKIQPCHVCKSKQGHRHVVVVGRDGSTLGRVAVCDVHSPPSGEMTPAGQEVVSRADLAFANGDQREIKRRRDRERRQAQRQVLDRHADEVAAVLDRIRAGDA